MRSSWLFVSGAVCGAAVSAVLARDAVHLHRTAAHKTDSIHAAADSARAHTEERFTFTAYAPIKEVAPLFGADKEREWSPSWNPQFIYPLPATDVEGMVFVVEHGPRRSVWVNTEFDIKRGRAQYVYIIPDVLATVITVSLKPEGNQTNVEVKYDRTALNAEADAHVRQLANQDSQAGPDWEAQINEYLKKRKSSAP